MEKSNRREQILSSAVAVFARKGYHDTAISDIIERAAIARGTFYLHFTSKRAIFDDVLERAFTLILEQVKPIELAKPLDRAHVVTQLTDNITRLAKLVAKESELFRVLLAETGSLDSSVRQKLARFYDRLALWIAESLEDGIHLGIVRRCDTELAAHALLGMCRGIFLAWVTGAIPLDEDGFVAEALELVRAGLLVGLGRPEEQRTSRRPAPPGRGRATHRRGLSRAHARRRWSPENEVPSQSSARLIAATCRECSRRGGIHPRPKALDMRTPDGRNF